MPPEGLKDGLKGGLKTFDVVYREVEIGSARFTLIQPRSAEELISEADFNRDERLPYWADLWPSARVLAARLLDESGGGRRALELGCGLGLVSVAAARAGFEVTLSDYYDDALLFARENVQRNCGVEPAALHLDWRHLPADLPRYDLVVAADVLYERPYGELVAGVIARTLSHTGLALVADPGRVGSGLFVEALKARGLSVDADHVVVVPEGSVEHRIRLYAIRLLSTSD